MINKYKNIIEESLVALCDNIHRDNGLKESITYSVLSGGKRLRPILMLTSYSMYNTEYDDVLSFALGIELIHNYSLIHDDLPSMDNDDYRRGLQTVHKKFDEATAILTGDALLTHAYTIMLNDTLNTKDFDLRDRKLKAMNLISKRSGIDGMILGQVIDIEDGLLSLDELINMYNRKTSDLFNAALVSGSIIGGASDIEQKYISDFAYHLGLMFQILDDLMDYERDIQIGKITVVTSLGMTEGRHLAEMHYNEALNCLKQLSIVFKRDTEELKQILMYINDK
ncbi:polyprenyl synthetase family protein [Microaceticoccus formicicus]|uniref:polyprenyl synthetase family protein n=1 Tax=Microaceticoccus formicicus TaxID=3118105 RepID=UPI003CD00CE3|nr:polyprenyl synthetase family protein [Peptoniphilaceae bacterium AMB_02]